MNKLKWGILGTGRIARTFTQALKVANGCEPFAVGSRTLEKAKHFAREFGLCRFYGSYEELVKDVDVDVIYIATPHNLHLQNTLLALQNKKHVLCEKPLGVNAMEVKLMTELAEKNNLFLMEALWSRFLPRIEKTKHLIDQGEIGDISLLTATFCIKSEHNPLHRHYNIDLCGGSILDIGIYNIFLSLYLFGKPTNFSASAVLDEQGGDNSAAYSFVNNNGSLSVMHSSFLASEPYVVAEIHGSKGKISLEHLWFFPGNIIIKYNNGKKRKLKFNTLSNGYEYQAEEVARCITEGRLQSPKWSWNDSLQLVQTMDSIRKSCGVYYPAHDTKYFFET